MIPDGLRSYRVHLEVDQLASGQSDDHLPLVDGAAHDGLLAGRLPLVHTLVGPDVADAVWVNLRGGRGGGELMADMSFR